MSITIHDKPQLVTPVYNDMTFLVSSTLASQENFKMKVDILWAGQLQKTLRFDKTPHGDYIKVDVHRMLETRFNYMFGQLTAVNGGFYTMQDTFRNYEVKFTEEIEGDPISSGTVSATGYAFNASLKYLDWINFDYNDYEILGAGTEKLLTNSPRTLKIREDEVAELGGISRSIKMTYARIITYDSNNVELQNVSISNSTYAGDQSLAIGGTFLCGPPNLQPAGIVFNSNVHHYTVQFTNNEVTRDPTSELFTFIIDRECSRHPLFRLHFLNRWGRFDSFTFKGSSTQNINYKRSQYQKITGYADLNTMTWENNAYARGTVTFDTLETEEYQLSTGWITEEESLWLQELVGSPATFWQLDTTNPKKFFAVNVSNSNYEVKKYANKKLFNLNITIQLAQPNHRQRA